MTPATIARIDQEARREDRESKDEADETREGLAEVRDLPEAR
jgi:hypothetical protein